MVRDTMTEPADTSSHVNRNEAVKDGPHCLVVSTATVSDADATSSVARPPDPQREHPVAHDHDYCRMDVRIAVCEEKRHFTLRTDSDALFYTGMALETFNILVSTLEGHGSCAFTLPVRTQVLMTLMKLKTNCTMGDLSRRFITPRSTAIKIISYWIDKLEEVLRPLILWLPKETIHATMPGAFKKDFPNTTCMVDFSESRLENPKHSDSHHTVKYQVAVAPCGLIMFISAAYGGRCSDKLITEDSGILDYLTPRDEVMLVQGSSIKDLLLERDVILVMPSFTENQRQLTEEQVTCKRKTTQVGVHVKRAIRRLKTYKILSQGVSVTMAPKINKILTICAALVNLKEDLVRDSR
ncbi:uncharacterized protein LOC131960636 [Centropristis striata]|uniref:uncharacterized protein LOC131960636 n=1 Tax=Centropristis striata TaxID=184440 RepID=UPI0027DF0F2B|nr:uncharacterized protein LOC131960636 [Centropristis striata]